MFVEEMTRLSGWITATPASQAVQALGGYVPAVQSVHILSIAAVIASAAMLNLRVLGLMNRSLGIANLRERFRRPLLAGVVMLVLSGLALLLAEPERSLVSQVFQLKMLLLAVVIVVTLQLHKAAARHAHDWDAAGVVPSSVKVTALVCLLLWVCIIFAGRWIAYAQY